MQTMDNKKDLTVYLVAGEASGDLLGAGVISSLTEHYEGNIRFTGIGGPEMIKSGLISLFPMEELSVMGLAEVLPRLPSLIKRINQTTTDIIKHKPDVVITIDAPDFCFRVAKKVRGRAPEIPLIHYVAPTVWAWRPGRARKIAQFLDHVLTLLPFEPPWFEREGLAATFVGHPAIEGGANAGDGVRFRKSHHISETTKLLTVLPGSRQGEISRHMPIFGETIQRLSAGNPDLQVVIPTIDTRLAQVQELASAWKTPVTIITGKSNRFDAFAASDAALAASGTVALELALASTPAIIAYKVNALTAWLGKRLIKVKYVNLVNIILEREAVPEFLQDKFHADHLTPALEKLLSDNEFRTIMQDDYSNAVAQLRPNEGTSGSKICAAVFSTIK